VYMKLDGSWVDSHDEVAEKSVWRLVLKTYHFMTSGL